MFQHFSKWLIEWLTREVPKERDCGRFITVRANGSAHFDVAAYLATAEGAARLARIAAQNVGEVA